MSALWPLFDLRIRIGDLELRLPDLDQLDQLADLAEAGVHEPDAMPFAIPWTDAEPLERGRSTMQHHWQTWSTAKPEGWMLNLVLVRDGVVLGTQAVGADKFPVTREVGSGSWIGRRYQGQGLGTQMRLGMLGFAFDGLGALSAISSAWEDNPSSIAVSRKAGYVEDGVSVGARRGERVTQLRFRMDLEQWRAVERPVITFEGLDGVREQLGIAQ